TQVRKLMKQPSNLQGNGDTQKREFQLIKQLLSLLKEIFMAGPLASFRHLQILNPETISDLLCRATKSYLMMIQPLWKTHCPIQTFVASGWNLFRERLVSIYLKMAI